MASVPPSAQRRVFGHAAAAGCDHRRVVGAGDGDGDGCRGADRAVVVGGGVGERDLTGGASGQGVEVGSRVEAVGTVAVEDQAAVARGRAGHQRVAGDRAVHIAGGRDAGVQGRCSRRCRQLAGLRHRRVVGAPDGDGDAAHCRAGRGSDRALGAGVAVAERVVDAHRGGGASLAFG